MLLVMFAADTNNLLTKPYCPCTLIAKRLPC